MDFKKNSLLSKFTKKMQSINFELIGSGKNAVVFRNTRPGEAGYVIKAFELDTGYLKFLKLVSEHPDNKYFPKILKYDKLKHKDFEGLHFVKMEELKDIEGSAFYTVYNPYERYFKYKGADIDPATFKTIRENYEEKKENNEGFYAALDLIYSMPLGDCIIDLNMNNVMVRPRSNWVITDPFVSFDDG